MFRSTILCSDDSPGIPPRRALFRLRGLRPLPRRQYVPFRRPGHDLLRRVPFRARRAHPRAARYGAARHPQACHRSCRRSRRRAVPLRQGWVSVPYFAPGGPLRPGVGAFLVLRPCFGAALARRRRAYAGCRHRRRRGLSGHRAVVPHFARRIALRAGAVPDGPRRP